MSRIVRKHLIAYLCDYTWLGKVMFWRSLRRPKDPFYRPWTRAERIRYCLEELGPTYVKLGQITSTRRDIIPKDICDELIKLQEEVTPFSYPEVRKQVKTWLGAYPEEIFLKFEPEPIASASIGQVHFATLKTGEDVVVKVQRPDINFTVESDLSIMLRLAQLAERYFPNMKIYNLVSRVKDFSNTIRKEMDYENESRNCDEFYENFKDNETVYVPKIYWQYTRPQIMTMERLKGIRLKDVDNIRAAGFDPTRIAITIGRSYLQQILIDGFFHGDPHPGNIFIIDNDTFALIDFGMIGRIDPEMRYHEMNYFIGIIAQDADIIVNTLYEIADIDKKTDVKALKRDVGIMLSKYPPGTKLGNVKITQIVQELMEIGFKHKVTLPGDFTLLDKTLIMLEGVGRYLDPHFDVAAVAKPLTEDLKKRMLAPAAIGRLAAKSVFSAKDLVFEFPKHAYKILKKLSQGEFKHNIQIESLEENIEVFNKKADKRTNRMVVAVVISSIMIGTALLTASNNGFKIWGMSLTRFAFDITVFFGIWLLMSIFKSNRL